jgi:hypothetical protein
MEILCEIINTGFSESHERGKNLAFAVDVVRSLRASMSSKMGVVQIRNCV